MTRLILACACATALVASRGAAQGSFEGTVTLTVTQPGGQTHQMTYYQLGSRVRHETEANGVTMATIVDGSTGDAMTLMPQQKQYLVFNLKTMGTQMARLGQGMSGTAGPMPDFSKVKVTATGQRETVAGIACTHYLFESTEVDTHGQADICGASGMGFLSVPGGAGLSSLATASASNPRLAELARQGFFPLKMTITDPHGQQTVWQVTQIDRTRPDAALFVPPPGYTKFSLPTMPGAKP